MCNWHRVADSLPHAAPGYKNSDPLLIVYRYGNGTYWTRAQYTPGNQEWRDEHNTLIKDVIAWAIVELPVQTGV